MSRHFLATIVPLDLFTARFIASVNVKAARVIGVCGAR